MESASPSSKRKVAWVTGASSGLGAATAHCLTDQGWTVAMTARSEERLMGKALKNRHLKPYPGDVTDAAAMKDIVARIEADLGPIDLVILNAGIGLTDTADDFSIDRFQKIMDVNLFGVAKCLEAALPSMLERKKGHVAFVASLAGYRGLPGSLSYGPSKAAVQNMAEALAIETLDKGIKVQVINPGFIKTAMTDQAGRKLPMLMPADLAAEKLVRGLSSWRFNIAFPLPLAIFMKTMRLLPCRLYFRLIKLMTARS